MQRCAQLDFFSLGQKRAVHPLYRAGRRLEWPKRAAELLRCRLSSPTDGAGTHEYSCGPETVFAAERRDVNAHVMSTRSSVALFKLRSTIRETPCVVSRFGKFRGGPCGLVRCRNGNCCEKVEGVDNWMFVAIRMEISGNFT